MTPWQAWKRPRRLIEMVDRPNLFVKIPATLPGLAAIEDMIAQGASINVTLIFSLPALPGRHAGLHPGAWSASWPPGGTLHGRERRQLLCLPSRLGDG